jgi:hypothetical protein
MITAASYIYSVWSISYLALIQGKKGRLMHRMPCSGDIKAKRPIPLTHARNFTAPDIFAPIPDIGDTCRAR